MPDENLEIQLSPIRDHTYTHWEGHPTRYPCVTNFCLIWLIKIFDRNGY